MCFLIDRVLLKLLAAESISVCMHAGMITLYLAFLAFITHALFVAGG